MELIRGISNLKPKHRHCVVTIGNFDGVHLGHQALLKNLTAIAHELNLPAVVITFEPQPNEFFHHAAIPPRLMRLREKIIALKNCGIDRVLCLRFDEQLAAIGAEDFIGKILVEGLAIRYIVIGDDFHFGFKRRGDLTLLQQVGDVANFTALKMGQIAVGNERVSSTRIRKALEAGDLSVAKKLLGRPFFMSGRVAHGNKRGRIIGFPTANIYLHRRAVPLSGVYVVKVHGINPVPLQGVANVGTRPTVGGTRSLLEVHLLDFAQDIYGCHVDVEFLHKLRDEERYESFDLLKQQILIDAQQARDFFHQDLPT